MNSPTVAPDDLVGRVQDLQERLAGAEDAATRDLADELVSAVVGMYGAGLEQIMATLAAGGAEGERLALALADDPLVATLLMIHDLHPVPLDRRVHLALEQVRPYMESHGGNVELISVVDGVARLRLEGSCSDCSASSVTLELAIKQALEQAAPDLDGLEVEGVEPPADAQPVVEPAVAPTWMEIERLDLLPVGSLAAADVAGATLVVANVGGTLLAYADRCAACDGPLHDGRLVDGVLHCPSCERTFFLPRAGRSMDGDRLQLDPVPLLRDNGTVKVALPV